MVDAGLALALGTSQRTAGAGVSRRAAPGMAVGVLNAVGPTGTRRCAVWLEDVPADEMDKTTTKRLQVTSRNPKKGYFSYPWSQQSIFLFVFPTWIGCVIVLTAYIQCIEFESERQQRNNITSSEKVAFSDRKSKSLFPPDVKFENPNPPPLPRQFII
jgi:hypothetical protein